MQRGREPGGRQMIGSTPLILIVLCGVFCMALGARSEASGAYLILSNADLGQIGRQGPGVVALTFGSAGLVLGGIFGVLIGLLLSRRKG